MTDLSNVKAGDFVALNTSSYFPPTIVAVDRVTPGGRLKVGGNYYDKYGRKCGKSERFQRAYIEPLTPEIRERVERSQIQVFLSAVEWTDLPTGTLRMIYNAIKAVQNTR